MKTKPEINLSRVRDDLQQLASIGASANSGVNRPSFSQADMDARRWLMQRMQQAGLDAQMDGVANISGRWKTDRTAPALIIGSHLDSVPNGGMFDGALGVIAGLEVVRSLKETGFIPGYPIEVLATSEEEGRFGGMLGAQALTGELDQDWFYSATDDQGQRLVDCMQQHGLDPESAFRLQRDDRDMLAFLELHIEQGPVLEHAGIPIGIVEGIAGVFHWSVTLQGQANHAGTTPMHLRKDAFLAVADFAQRFNRIIKQHGSENARLTVGKLELSPGFAHTVPGKVTFTLVGKDYRNQDLHKLADGCRAELEQVAADKGISVSIQEVSFLESVPCDGQIVATLQAGANVLNLPCMRMFSGAGHDAQVFARHTRAGMIFVPSVGGISHAPQELTHWEDIKAGTDLLLHAVMHLLGQ